MAQNNGEKLADYPSQGVLVSSMIKDAKVRHVAIARLQPDDFIGIDRAIFEWIHRHNGEFSYPKLRHELKGDTLERLKEIDSEYLFETLTPETAEPHILSILKYATLRRFRSAIGWFQNLITPAADPEDVASKLVLKLVELRNRGRATQAVSMDKAANDLLVMEEQWHAGNTYADSVATGIDTLDRKLGGLQRGEVTVLAARTGVGKTQMAIQWGQTVAKRMKDSGKDACVYMFSMEMPEHKIIARLAQAGSGISTAKVRQQEVTKAERQAWRDEVARIGELKEHFIIDPDPCPTAAQMFHRVAAEAAVRKDKVELVIVDFLELPESKQDNATQKIDETMKAMKRIAKEFNIPVLVLAQLNRKVEERADKKPELADLRQSGMIEHLANTVLMIYRPDAYKRMVGNEKTYPNSKLAEEARKLDKYGANTILMIPKNRDGEPRKGVLMHFEGEITRFSQLQDSLQTTKERMQTQEVDEAVEAIYRG